MFYEVREQRENRTQVQAVCTSPEAFDNLCENVGGLEAIKVCMEQGSLSIQASNKETLDYITAKLSTDEATNKAA